MKRQSFINVVTKAVFLCIAAVALAGCSTGALQPVTQTETPIATGGGEEGGGTTGIVDQDSAIKALATYSTEAIFAALGYASSANFTPAISVSKTMDDLLLSAVVKTDYCAVSGSVTADTKDLYYIPQENKLIDPEAPDFVLGCAQFGTINLTFDKCVPADGLLLDGPMTIDTIIFDLACEGETSGVYVSQAQAALGTFPFIDYHVANEFRLLFDGVSASGLSFTWGADPDDQLTFSWLEQKGRVLNGKVVEADVVGAKTDQGICAADASGAFACSPAMGYPAAVCDDPSQVCQTAADCGGPSAGVCMKGVHQANGCCVAIPDKLSNSCTNLKSEGPNSALPVPAASYTDANGLLVYAPLTVIDHVYQPMAFLEATCRHGGTPGETAFFKKSCACVMASGGGGGGCGGGCGAEGGPCCATDPMCCGNGNQAVECIIDTCVDCNAHPDLCGQVCGAPLLLCCGNRGDPDVTRCPQGGTCVLGDPAHGTPDRCQLPCGVENGQCCQSDSPCGAGLECQQGTCVVPCGVAAGSPCCRVLGVPQCSTTDLACNASNNTCVSCQTQAGVQCDGAGLVCCGSGSPPLACVFPPPPACGADFSPCCPTDPPTCANPSSKCDPTYRICSPSGPPLAQSGSCAACGGTNSDESSQPCCVDPYGAPACNSGMVCQFDPAQGRNSCLPCGGNGQPCCLGAGGGLPTCFDPNDPTLVCALGSLTCQPCVTETNSCSDASVCCGGPTPLGCSDLDFKNGISGTCAQPCGGTGEVCCSQGQACALGECASDTNTCKLCGDVSQPCCGGYQCNAGSFCDSSQYPSICAECGGPGQICCNGSQCNDQSACDYQHGGICPVCGDSTCADSERQCDPRIQGQFACPQDCGTPPASEADSCSDGIDNDCDGMTDCGDPDCAASPMCCGGFQQPCCDGTSCNIPLSCQGGTCLPPPPACPGSVPCAYVNGAGDLADLGGGPPLSCEQVGYGACVDGGVNEDCCGVPQVCPFTMDMSGNGNGPVIGWTCYVAGLFVEQPNPSPGDPTSCPAVTRGVATACDGVSDCCVAPK